MLCSRCQGNITGDLMELLYRVLISVDKMAQEDFFFFQASFLQSRQMHFVLGQALIQFRQEYILQLLGRSGNDDDIDGDGFGAADAADLAGFNGFQQHILVVVQGMGFIQK